MGLIYYDIHAGSLQTLHVGLKISVTICIVDSQLAIWTIAADHEPTASVKVTFRTLAMVLVF